MADRSKAAYGPPPSYESVIGHSRLGDSETRQEESYYYYYNPKPKEPSAPSLEVKEDYSSIPSLAYYRENWLDYHHPSPRNFHQHAIKVTEERGPAANHQVYAQVSHLYPNPWAAGRALGMTFEDIRDVCHRKHGNNKTYLPWPIDKTVWIEDNTIKHTWL